MEELASVRSTYKKAFKQLIIQALVAIRVCKLLYIFYNTFQYIIKIYYKI